MVAPAGRAKPLIRASRMATTDSPLTAQVTTGDWSREWWGGWACPILLFRAGWRDETRR
jgi:hypothetical protein